MRTRKIVAVAASLLAATPAITAAQPGTGGPGMRQPQQQMHPQMPGMMGPGMMGQGPQGMMGQGPQGMMGMMHGGATMMPMRMMMILVDTNADGALSLEEVQAAHARIFKAVDVDGDGKVTFDEMQAFLHGTRGPGMQ